MKTSCSIPSNLAQIQYVKSEVIQFFLYIFKFYQLVQGMNIPSLDFDVMIAVGWALYTMCTVSIHVVIVILRVMYVHDYSWLNTAVGCLTLTFCWVTSENHHFTFQKLFCLQAAVVFWSHSSFSFTVSFLSDMPLATVCDPVHWTLTRYNQLGKLHLGSQIGGVDHTLGNRKYPLPIHWYTHTHVLHNNKSVINTLNYMTNIHQFMTQILEILWVEEVGYLKFD